MNADRLPVAGTSLGILLIGVILCELIAIAFFDPGVDPAFVANIITSLPFIGILAYGGYWLRNGPIPDARFRRIAAWTLLGLGFFIGFFSIVAIFTLEHWISRLGIIRWAVAVGGGLGLLVGIFEARATQNAVATERVRIRNEELSRQNKQLEEFANTLAHDVRNPISVAKGNLELIQRKEDQPRLKTVESAIDRIEAIVDKTLTLAKSGQTIGEPSTIAIADIAAHSWRNVQTDTAELRVNDPPTIQGDPDRLHHLFENLFRNAIVHGGSDVTVTVGRLPDGFFVADDGPGIPADDRDAVLDAGYSTTHEGTGIGLTIVTQIGQAHGWDINVTESVDGGARFEFIGATQEHDSLEQPSATQSITT